ncbi:MAG TPA: hypothetical protein PKD86_00500, partial [Gemmatales bacterium]|nr:hypothetical protein [Gemmatales bacterium]
ADAAASGQILKFTGNEYLQGLENGDFAICVAWSGDIFSLGEESGIEFMVPDTGGTHEATPPTPVMERPRPQNYTPTEPPPPRHDVYTADEMLLTGTAAEVISVVKCDGRVIGTGKPGPVFRRLRQCYMDLTQGKYRWTRNTENYMHADWNNS